jgi:peptidoglycan/LPS O-acetylase OafA/YrhL
VKSKSFRLEIQALRALAIVGVVLGHFWPQVFSGGFIGVDIFLVLSGFLAVKSLLKSDKISDGFKFIIKRIRRLLPAISVVLIISSIAIFLIEPMTRFTNLSKQILASLYFYQNWYLIGQQTDYFAENTDTSPFQHFWYLGAQEQTILGFALIVILLSLISKLIRVITKTKTKTNKLIKIILLVVLISVTIASLYYSVVYTKQDPSAAYFSTWTRVWELAIGGILAIVLPNGIKEKAPKTRTILTFICFIFLISCFFIIDDTKMPFPGLWALVPVLLTIIIIACAVQSKVFSFKPIKFTADISYSLYLYHWPIWILLGVYCQNEFSNNNYQTLLPFVCLVISILLGFLSKKFIEDIAFRVKFKKLIVNIIIFILVFLLLPVGSSEALAGYYQHKAASAEKTYNKVLKKIQKDHSLCFGAMVTTGCEPVSLSKDLVPLPILGDKYRTPTCANKNAICRTIKNKNNVKTIAVLGDSHASMWRPAFKYFATTNHYNYTDYSMSACGIILSSNSPSWNFGRTCIKNLPGQLEDIKRTKPDVLVITQASYREADLSDSQFQQSITDKEVLFRDLSKYVGQIIIMKDTPNTYLDNSPKFSPTNCLINKNNQRCAINKAIGILKDSDVEAAINLGIKVMDLNDIVCPEYGKPGASEILGTCPVVQGGVNMYIDYSHLNPLYAETAANLVNDKLSSLISK